ncbi:MAG: hypothetical protein AB7U82_34885 [Blastocatellales bacterium]
MSTTTIATQTLTPEDAKLLVEFLEDQWGELATHLMRHADKQGIAAEEAATRICDALRAQAGMPAYADQIF